MSSTGVDARSSAIADADSPTSINPDAPTSPDRDAAQGAIGPDAAPVADRPDGQPPTSSASDAGTCLPADPARCEQYRDLGCDGGPSQLHEQLHERCLAAAKRYDAAPFASYLACLTATVDQDGVCSSVDQAHDTCKYEAMSVDGCVSEEAFCRIERVTRCYGGAPEWCDEAHARFNSAYLASIDVGCFPEQPGGACPRDYARCVDEREW